jgi:hypothetical protein
VVVYLQLGAFWVGTSLSPRIVHTGPVEQASTMLRNTGSESG